MTAASSWMGVSWTMKWGSDPSWWLPVDDAPMEPRKGGVYVDYFGRSTAPERPRLAVEEYLERAYRALGAEVDQLASRRRDPGIRELRELAAVLAVEKFEQRVREIAAVLEKNPGSVSRGVSAAAERRSSDPGFARRLRDLDEGILAHGSKRES